MLMEQLHDPHFWVLVSSLIFAGVAFKFGRAPLMAMLDARTAKIKAELLEAASLKKQAEDMLAEIEKKHKDAEKTAKKIVDEAKESAARLQADAETKLKDSIARREAQLMERIARAEASAVEELRAQAADIAAKAAETLLLEAADKRGAKMVDESIADIPAKLN